MLVAVAAVVIGASAISAASGNPSPVAAAASSATTTSPSSTTPAAPASVMPPIRHVFIIILENESASVTFSSDPPAPYLAKTLTSEGAFLPNYYGIGHASNDNYIAMISGQAPTADNQSDCQQFGNFPTTATGAYGQQLGEGCVYPSDIQNIATQLDAAGYTWRDYNESMGNDPTRESAECGHPAVGSQDHTQTETPTDAYATRHNPFVYFHAIIDNTALCDSHVVNLNDLPTDLASASTTPNYVFITPDLCGDGHDNPCDDPSRPGGFAGIEQFLQQWVPQITGSAAFKEQNGLLLITFDEASDSDTSSCCGEIPGPGSPAPGIGGEGGGDVGAVLLSPCIKPGTVSTRPYNHYTMLRSVEDIFGLSHLGYAQLPGESDFGSDVFTGKCDSPPTVGLRVPALASSTGSSTRVPISWSSPNAGSTFEVQAERTSGSSPGPVQTLANGTSAHSLSFAAAAGQTYAIRIQPTNAVGLTGDWVTATLVVPTVAKAPGAKLSGRWRSVQLAGAWQGRAEVGSGKHTSYTYSFTGGALSIVGSRSAAGGSASVVLDGSTTKIDLHSAKTKARVVIYHRNLATGAHKLTIRVLTGSVTVEGLAIADLQ
jgi:phosphatidylinositol-3-phosphatase